MGCDIHLVLERKIGGAWHTWERDPEAADGQLIWRNYEFFNALAGVRWRGGPKPKGFPSDAGVVSKYMYDLWGKDAHSASWYPLKEFMALFYQHNSGYEANIANMLDPEDGWYMTARLLNLYDEDLDNFRFVFWFDN